MDRLTSYKSECRREMICGYEDCDTCEEYCPHLNEDNCSCLQEVLGKLAEYEDTGITPGQIREIDRLYAEKCKELAECRKNQLAGKKLAIIAAGMKKLREYEGLEEQGKLLKLPCAVGDTVYAIHCISESRNLIYDFKIDTLHLALNAINGGFGKTVFLTKEEAEAALKEL